MPDARKGDLVQIHAIILDPTERPDTLPACTKAVPYECWIKGFLLNGQANLGDEVKIETFIGREISGVLEQVSPVYDHHFGVPQRELLSIGSESLKKLEQMRNRSS